ncbi:30S ribosomal protein S17 [uncultured archaeon]|nr:30S ribosomal protein S17 [uncultured archaeon]
MVEKIKTTKKEESKTSGNCADKFCPFHGREAVKLRGRTFEGEVINKLPGRVKIQFDRVSYISKYERFDRRRTKLHARLPDCLKEEVHVGDWIQISECRPLSKIIHFIVTKKIRGKTAPNGVSSAEQKEKTQ